MDINAKFLDKLVVWIIVDFIGEPCMDILKASKYNFLTEVDGQHVAFNSKNCALAKVNDIFFGYS